MPGKPDAAGTEKHRRARSQPVCPRILALLAALLALPGLASAQEWIPRRYGEIQALDKVNARVLTLRATVGEPARFGTLSILLRACHSRAPDEVPDAAAFLEITDERSPPGSGPVFRGWMFADAPAVNMFEHPVYDLRILSCR